MKPTAFFGVPRVWEKIQAGIQALLTMEQDEAKRAAVAAAMETGREYVLSCQYGNTTPDELAARFAAADAAVLTPIKGLLGLDQAVNVVSAAAPLPPEVAAFFAGLGMKILDVYGMTETTGAFTTNTPAAFRLGTVGRPVPGIEVKIADDGEILARGPLNTPGYLNLPEQTRALLDEDGWLHTGDIGTIDADGFVCVRRPQEGTDHHLGRREHLAGRRRERAGRATRWSARRWPSATGASSSSRCSRWTARSRRPGRRARGIEASSLAELAENPVVLAGRGRRRSRRRTSSWPGCSRSSAGGCCRWSGRRRARS